MKNKKYDMEISNTVLQNNIKRITGQTYRLLPTREEGGDWIKPLETLIIELAGFSSLCEENENFFVLLCKMEGILIKGKELEFSSFRRSVFECCSLLNKIEQSFADE